jgi:hypothetical protein
MSAFFDMNIARLCRLFWFRLVSGNRKDIIVRYLNPLGAFELTRSPAVSWSTLRGL